MAQETLDDLLPRGEFRERLIRMFTELYSRPSKEADREYTSELLFDKDQIESELHVQDAEITFTVSESGHLSEGWLMYAMRITTDGVNPIYFQKAEDGGFNHVANITSGEILDAGTYQFVFWRSGETGITRATVMLPSEQVVNLNPLTIPASFAAVLGTDPDTEVDLSWTAVPNASSLELQFSTTGESGPWSTAIPLAGGATSYAHTGLTPGTTYHYRLRAVGDGVDYANSNYAVTAITTQDNSDVTDPEFTSVPATSATDIPVNGRVVITSNEALVDSDGTTEITSANIMDYLSAVDSGANPVDIIATIDAGKLNITIDPDLVWPSNDDITITLNGVADANGNTPPPFVITFSTNDYTLASNNWVEFTGAVNTAISALFTAADANFDIGWTQRDMNMSVSSTLARKWATGQRTILCNNLPPDFSQLHFKFYEAGVSDVDADAREVIWEDALDTSEIDIRIEYRGSVDTNDGLDRLKLFINDVENTDKSLVSSGSWPFDIRPSTAPFRFGPSNALVKDMFIRTNNGATTQLFIPIMRTGQDTSGNNRHGAWV